MRFYLSSAHRVEKKTTREKFYFSYATFLSLLRHQFNDPEELHLNSSHVWLRDEFLVKELRLKWKLLMKLYELTLIKIKFSASPNTFFSLKILSSQKSHFYFTFKAQFCSFLFQKSSQFCRSFISQ
jgi:hypothetical protein